MSDDEETLMVSAAVAASFITAAVSRNIRRRKHRFWVHPLFQHRPQQDVYNTLIAEL